MTFRSFVKPFERTAEIWENFDRIKSLSPVKPPLVFSQVQNTFKPSMLELSFMLQARDPQSRFASRVGFGLKIDKMLGLVYVFA